MARTCLCSLTVMLVICPPCGADVLDEIAPCAVVCVGNDAPAEEQQAARLILETLKTKSDSALLLSDERVLSAPFAKSGQWHVIAVGTPDTNSVLFRYPSYWSLDRELHYAPFGNMPAAPFTETRGFYVGGFGYFFAGRNVGFVEFDRSPFYAAMIVSAPGEDKSSGEETRPLRFLTRVTGSTAEGVLLGAKRFVETRMLYGVAIGPPRWPRPHDLWNLDDEYIKPDPPPWIPKGTLLGGSQTGKGSPLCFLGWLMADRGMYAGFLEITGCRPIQMWRVKYATGAGPTDFHRSPHHLASANEFLIVKLGTSAGLLPALKNLGVNLPLSIGGKTCYQVETEVSGGSKRTPTMERGSSQPSKATAAPITCIFPTMIAGDPYLILADFDEGYTAPAMNALIKSLRQQPQGSSAPHTWSASSGITSFLSQMNVPCSSRFSSGLTKVNVPVIVSPITSNSISTMCRAMRYPVK